MDENPEEKPGDKPSEEYVPWQAPAQPVPPVEEPAQTPETPETQESPPEGEKPPDGGPEPAQPEGPPEGQAEIPITNQDALSMEFLYYGSVLKVVAPTLSADPDKQQAMPWIKKLFRPEYQTSKLREKRNRYLISLSINLLNDEITGIFLEKPPEDALEDLKNVHPDPSTAAEWELDRMWQETLLSLPDDFEMMGCSVHDAPNQCKEDHKIDKILDQEFQYLLYLTRPYAALLPAEDKTRTSAWLQTLCTIHGEACSSMKAIRNDYIMALLGYIHDLRIVGPFTDYPPVLLQPLHIAAKEAARINPVIDPTSPEANQFLLDQPVPDDGAFCYVALTGDLIASNL